MMPGLPGSNYARDIEAFKQLFERSEFKPDMLKIYPCLVIKGTEIYEWWRRGDYKPYDTAEAVKIVAEIKSFVPEWIRIMRVQREIPAQLIIAGPKAGNIRELAKERLLREGKRCRCIRCREVGHRRIMPNDSLEKWEIASMEYDASMGREIFLSVENKRDDLIAAYVRLRIPSEKAHRDEIKDGCAIIRELKVCGFQVPVGEFYTGAWQHRGLGRVLLREAERVAAERYNCNKILVLSALGTKLYYRKAGYNYDGPYMSKLLS
jgi:elongator complex protein 3